jgi:hypothetical protein
VIAGEKRPDGRARYIEFFGRLARPLRQPLPRQTKPATDARDCAGERGGRRVTGEEIAVEGEH